MSTAPKSKRRKSEQRSKHVYKVGNGFIDLDFFLNGPSKKDADDEVIKEAESTTEPGAEASPIQEKPTTDDATAQEEQPGSDADAAALTSGNRKRRRGKQRGGDGGRWRDDHITGDPSLFATRKALPIWDSRNAIRQSLSTSDVLVLVGETGSGKSTQVPQYLCTEPWCTGLVAITQPRRVAATTLANRVSREMGTPLTGIDANDPNARGRVGYSVRFDHKVPKGTKVKFLTEGMLLQEMVRDPALRQYSAVVVDEVHERSVDADLLLGFLRQILQSSAKDRAAANDDDSSARALGKRQQRDSRHPLKVVVMSATADVNKIHSFFTTDANTVVAPSAVARPQHAKVDVLHIPGRQFPVEIIHTPEPVEDILEALVKTVFQIHVQEPLPGDILVFLSGQEEIDAAKRLIDERAANLASNVPHVEACPLYGQLSIEAQNKAFQPASRPFTRKVVLATNIAETSVTVPGVRYVVDNGKAKVKMFRARLGLESLLAKPIAKSSAIQRAGRAGREGPGKCYRLYTEQSYNQELAPVELPEILRIDLLGAVLTMKARGIDNTFTFPLMDEPDHDLMERSLIQLRRLGALADDVTITEDGRTMSLLPVSAAFGRVLLDAAAAGCLLEAIDIVACLTAGDDIFLRLQSEQDRDDVDEFRKELFRREGDLLTYLTTMQRLVTVRSNLWKPWCQKRRINLRNMRQALNIRRQLRGICVRQKMLAAEDVAEANEALSSSEANFVPLSPDRTDALLRCFLNGFVLKTAMLAPDGSYVTTEGKHVVAIHPSSVLHGRKTEAIMYLEQVFTTKNYARKVSAVQSDWIVEALRSQQI
ncbi:ATP-dependent RNA helicase DHR2 [Sporothrix schenckii 1099-18]|uniref:RNA helicase n=1 Tax=Sporothrix schenckii 1099-18 TaxID=1397361 RepID=A0A0F2M5Y1_SPOSC|nr:ATP-dependent RNA helicase DHR2 [Sporothrix schenckii 1099-18]KJR84494.1 ATP-dependent RNA helicase DHR2 [Sporothrix schenckii 1099-18]